MSERSEDHTANDSGADLAPIQPTPFPFVHWTDSFSPSSSTAHRWAFFITRCASWVANPSRNAMSSYRRLPSHFHLPLAVRKSVFKHSCRQVCVCLSSAGTFKALWSVSHSPWACLCLSVRVCVCACVYVCVCVFYWRALIWNLAHCMMLISNTSFSLTGY